MAHIVLATERTKLLCMITEDVNVITQLFNMSHGDALKWINENTEHQKNMDIVFLMLFLRTVVNISGIAAVKR
jgi:predicted nucleic acid-binding protein